MDVDLGQGTQRFTKLMEEQKADLMKQGACFRCHQDGHMSHNCLRKFGSTNVGRLAPTSRKATMATGVINEPIEELLKNMKDCLTTEEMKQKFFDGVIEKGFV